MSEAATTSLINPMVPDMITDDFPVPGKIARDH
jgi:hypothetical protein